MASRYYPPGMRSAVKVVSAQATVVMRLGHMVTFLGRALAAVPWTLRHYRKEFLRILADVTWGNGSIVVGGGTAGVIIVLGAAAGAIVGIEGYNALHLLGLEPATGMIASTATTRELAPIMASLAFAAQAGCRFTAQLGAMRISEEIDAMEALAIRPIPYLVTTRLMASVVAVVPLYLLCLALNYVAVKVVIGLSGGVSTGTYEHYFRLVLSATDIGYSLVKAVVFVIITSTIQCYYGFFASGGPQGVGTAAGRAMRASISAMIFVNLLLTVAFWGIGSGARLGG
ncbi:ABC transporter permease [Rhodococcus sp. IEGM 1366]|uniref:ABC transporter permease n=1 Tax=Rhodococcus sp. IEGM 1366 TaxID=3082223 RepID=UPI002955041E|nr:ABC transporter permease [Rhodococcus sp. IEGM 1366]MDV8069323.1 ABC transporter permease [Rhodococcus sp. IEGM 1366]